MKPRRSDRHGEKRHRFSKPRIVLFICAKRKSCRNGGDGGGKLRNGDQKGRPEEHQDRGSKSRQKHYSFQSATCHLFLRHEINGYANIITLLPISNCKLFRVRHSFFCDESSKNRNTICTVYRRVTFSNLGTQTFNSLPEK